jgi:hypothetical protein
MSDLENLSDKTSQPPILEFEGYVLRPFDGWYLWFENPEGEGTQLRKAEFLATLIKLFKKTF